MNIERRPEEAAGKIAEKKVEKAAKWGTYGGDPVVYDLSVEGLEQEVVPLQIEISPRRYTEKEAAEVFAKIKTGLLEEILGENLSLQEVKSDLVLPTEKSGGIRIAWRSNDPEILDDEGTVWWARKNQVLEKPEEPR